MLCKSMSCLCVAVGVLLLLGFSAVCGAQSATINVTGNVFVDVNSNGKRDAGEQGISGVVVSNGIDSVLTDEKGDYRFARTEPGRSRFVTVVTPSGYRNTSLFFSRITAGVTEMKADFALAPAPETLSPDFSFVQISDIHIPYTTNLAGDLSTIAKHKPAFIVATGDLVNIGTVRESYQTYKDTIERSIIPVYCAMGNHDAPVENFEEFLGPSYYAFDYGGRHFIVLNCTTETRRQYVWLKNEMALQPKGKEVIVFQHFPPDEKLMDTLGDYNTRAVLTGHWHSSKVHTYKGIMCISTATLPFGGIDASPRGYRILTFKGGKLSIEDRLAGCEDLIVIAAPGDGQRVPAGKLQVRATAYDSGSDVVKAEYRIDNGRFRPMTKAGRLIWIADDASVNAGAHTITVSCTLSSGKVLSRESRFTAVKEAFPAPKPGTDWLMARHDLHGTGVADDHVAPPLHLAWSRSIGGILHFSSPVVADGTVYVGVADEENLGKAGVCAVDAKTGKVKWRYQTHCSVKNTPAVDGSSVYAATVDGIIIAIDAKTGRERWRYELGEPLERRLYASPVVCDGVVYTGTAARFVALDARTGSKIWQAEPMGSDWLNCYSPPVLTDDALYLGFIWSPCTKLDRKTGKKIWSYNTGWDAGHASSVLHGDTLFFSIGKRMRAIDINTGTDLPSWSYPTPNGWPMSSPALHNSRLYFGTEDGSIVAISTTDAKEVWSYQTGASKHFFYPYSAKLHPVISSPVVSGNVVYCGAADGKLYAISADDGRELWSYDTGMPITSSPAVSGNTVYVTGYDGTIYAFTSNV